MDAHLPAAYVPRERLRLEAYRRLGGARVVEEVEALAAELADRYGPPPPPVRNLLELAGVRAQATAVGLTELVCFGGRDEPAHLAVRAPHRGPGGPGRPRASRHRPTGAPPGRVIGWPLTGYRTWRSPSGTG